MCRQTAMQSPHATWPGCDPCRRLPADFYSRPWKTPTSRWRVRDSRPSWPTWLQQRDIVDSLFTAALPEAPLIAYVAKWLGGSIICPLDGCSAEGTSTHGLQDQSRLGVRRAKIHFRRTGSWVPQLRTSWSCARKRRREKASSSEDSSQ